MQSQAFLNQTKNQHQESQIHNSSQIPSSSIIHPHAYAHNYDAPNLWYHVGGLVGEGDHITICQQKMLTYSVAPHDIIYCATLSTLQLVSIILSTVERGGWIHKKQRGQETRTAWTTSVELRWREMGACNKPASLWLILEESRCLGWLEDGFVMLLHELVSVSTLTA